MNVDAFGGKIRARVSSDDRGDKRTWDVAGTASEISLAQMSDALDLTDRASGSSARLQVHFPRGSDEAAGSDGRRLGRSDGADLAGSDGRHHHDRRLAL